MSGMDSIGPVAGLVLWIVTAAVAIGAAAAAAWLHRRLARAERELRAVRAAIAETANVAGGARAAERASREQLERLMDRLGRLELQTDARGYEQAIRFAARGERADRLVSYFGLTEGEAALVRLLHGDRSREPGGNARPSP
jgi:hypothetical protein